MQVLSFRYIKNIKRYKERITVSGDERGFMEVTKLEKIDTKKTKVYLDGEYAFILYPQDLRKYKIVENAELSEEKYNEIMTETVIRRAKQKAMALLKRSDRTEKELRLKLKQNEYPEEAIEEAVAYVMKYGYVDDERYLENYVFYKKGSKSKRIMELELQQKGLSKEQIREQMEKEEVNDEEAIQKAIRKKIGTKTELSYEETQKVAAYLYRKGFKEEDIRKYLWNRVTE